PASPASGQARTPAAYARPSADDASSSVDARPSSARRTLDAASVAAFHRAALVLNCASLRWCNTVCNDVNLQRTLLGMLPAELAEPFISAPTLIACAHAHAAGCARNGSAALPPAQVAALLTPFQGLNAERFVVPPVRALAPLLHWLRFRFPAGVDSPAELVLRPGATCAPTVMRLRAGGACDNFPLAAPVRQPITGEPVRVTAFALIEVLQAGVVQAPVHPMLQALLLAALLRALRVPARLVYSAPHVSNEQAQDLLDAGRAGKKRARAAQTARRSNGGSSASVVDTVPDRAAAPASLRASPAYKPHALSQADARATRNAVCCWWVEAFASGEPPAAAEQHARHGWMPVDAGRGTVGDASALVQAHTRAHPPTQVLSISVVGHVKDVTPRYWPRMSEVAAVRTRTGLYMRTNVPLAKALGQLRTVRAQRVNDENGGVAHTSRRYGGAVSSMSLVVDGTLVPLPQDAVQTESEARTAAAAAAAYALGMPPPRGGSAPRAHVPSWWDDTLVQVSARPCSSVPRVENEDAFVAGVKRGRSAMTAPIALDSDVSEPEVEAVNNSDSAAPFAEDVPTCTHPVRSSGTRSGIACGSSARTAAPVSAGAGAVAPLEPFPTAAAAYAKHPQYVLPKFIGMFIAAWLLWSLPGLSCLTIFTCTCFLPYARARVCEHTQVWTRCCAMPTAVRRLL
ncbi:hypothetical protein EON67_02610, partial [archaeon]